MGESEIESVVVDLLTIDLENKIAPEWGYFWVSD